ncbi:MAG: Transcription initiation factor TFIID subunit 1 [Marteilia pararefringens]
MPGQPPYNKVVQCFENNMFKGMTVKHSTNPNDFLLVRTREHIYLREINGVFSVGQQIPQIEVLTPCSKQAVAFNRDFFKVYVYRLFRIAKEDGYRVKMDDIKKAFPNTSENTLRKRLKHCADFKRLGCAANKNGNLVNYWILRDDFVIPDETIVSKMVSPEECCSFYSMIVAYQRLRDNGYVNKLVSLDDEDNLLDNNVRMEDELLAAPWNTTKTYLECQRGRAQYQVYGNADPTGSGEGFSFVKRVIRPPRDDTYLLNAVQAIRNCENHRKIEAAIKRLSIGEARRLLTLYDFINPDEIMELNKWNIIERIIETYREHRDYPLVVPIESLELMPENDQQSLAARKESYGFLQQRFKTDCQAVFDAQLQLLERNDEPDLSADFYSNFSSLVEFVAASDNSTNYKVEQDYNAPHQMMLMEDTKTNQTNHETLEELGRNIEQMLAEDEELMDPSNLSQDGKNNNNQQAGLESSRQITSPLSNNNNNNTSSNNQLVLSSKDDSKDHHLVEIDETTETQQQANNLFFKKKLRIRRSFRDDEGRVYTRIELVTNASIIELYVKSRQSPDTPQDDWEFSGKGFKDWQHNYNKNSNSSLQHGGSGASTIRKRKKPINAAPPRKRPKSEKVLKLKCGACGQVGHMKSNKDCPYYQRTQAKMISKKNAIGVPNFQNMNYNSSIAHSPNAMIQAGNSQMTSQKFETNPSKQKNNSKVILVTGYHPPEPIDDLMKDSSDDESNSMLHNIVDEESKADPKLFDNFSNQFFRPKQKTKSVDLDEDIVQNFVQDNIFRSSRNWLYDEVNKYLHLFTLIKTGSPKYLFNKFIIQILNHLYQMNNSEPFILPVDESFAPDYYSIIKNPLCLSDMMKKADSNQYVEFKQVDDDFARIITNSRIYNGHQSPFTISARSLVAEYKNFLFSNRLALSYINLLNSPSESQNANYILIAYLCQILTILAQSEVGSKFIHSNNLEADIFQMYSCICKLKYLDYKSYHHDIMRLCEASIDLQSPDIRETDVKSFSIMASNLLALYEIPLRTLFGLLESKKLPSSLTKINDSPSPPVVTNAMQYISDSTSDDTVVDALTLENSLATVE